MGYNDRTIGHKCFLYFVWVVFDGKINLIVQAEAAVNDQTILFIKKKQQ